MAAAKLLPLLLSAVFLFSLGFGGCGVAAEEDVQVLPETVSDGTGSSAFQAESDQLKSEIHHLETRLAEDDNILKSKDEAIAKLEQAVQEKSSSISQLQSEIESVQKKGTSDADDRASKAFAQATELQKQFEHLEKELDTQSKEKNEFEAQAHEAEKKVEELSMKLKDLQKVIDEQLAKIQETERALQVAEEEMIRAKSEAGMRIKELLEVHGSWLPPWLAEHTIRLQSFIATKWNEHGEPVMKILLQKGMKMKTQLGGWASPHMETMKNDWAPAMKERWLMTVNYIEPHLEGTTGKAVEAYEAFKTSVMPHIVKVQELVDPYYQEVKKFSKPYVDQVATVAKPHVEKARVALNPYTTKAVHGCTKFLETATTHHVQIQATVREKMENHEFARHLATNELVWFVASALLALPAIILFRLCSSMFFSKAKKSPHLAQPQLYGRRKGKRGHSEK